MTERDHVYIGIAQADGQIVKGSLVTDSNGRRYIASGPARNIWTMVWPEQTIELTHENIEKLREILSFENHKKMLNDAN